MISENGKYTFLPYLIGVPLPAKFQGTEHGSKKNCIKNHLKPKHCDFMQFQFCAVYGNITADKSITVYGTYAKCFQHPCNIKLMTERFYRLENTALHKNMKHNNHKHG